MVFRDFSWFAVAGPSSSVVAPRPRATLSMAWSRLAASVCKYFSVVAMLAWPRSAWTSRREAPLLSACVAKVWRSGDCQRF